VLLFILRSPFCFIWFRNTIIFLAGLLLFTPNYFALPLFSFSYTCKLEGAGGEQLLIIMCLLKPRNLEGRQLMTIAIPPIGVLLMSYGGPDSLADLPGYLADIRNGRTTSRVLLDEMRHNYSLVGGKSPLLEFCRKQAVALEKELNAVGGNYKVYLGMRHWTPWIEETIRDMLSDGIEQAVALVLAPHYSRFESEKFYQKIDAGLKHYGGNIKFGYIKSHHTAPKYIEALANRVKSGIAGWSKESQESVHVLFSAHSLPERILKMGDPYQEQLFETVRLVVEKAALRADQWSWSYQSAGRSPEPWLGPSLEEQLQTLADKGIKGVVSVPVGFVCDNVEILYDIDIKAKETARKLGMRLERPLALNDDPLYIEALASLILENTPSPALR
jgi:ferrochelatase